MSRYHNSYHQKLDIMSPMELDSIHLKMIDLLRADARISMAALATQLGISRANAYARFEALTSNGVIEGFHARINPTAVGHSVSALVFLHLRQSQWADFRSRLDTVPELEYFAVTTGEYDAMLLLRATDVAAIHQLVAMKISQWPSVRASQTIFLMDEAFSAAPLSERALVEATEKFGAQPLGMMRYVQTPARQSAVAPAAKPAARANRSAASRGTTAK